MAGMTDISRAAEAAREDARTTKGQFGAQERSAPEATLVEHRPDSDILDSLAYVHGGDSVRAQERFMSHRIDAFIQDARETNPDATGAVFDWNYDDGVTRLTFSHYTDASGDPLDLDDYPDINDFEFDSTRDASAAGFVSHETIDGSTLTFTEFPEPDMAKARAELSVADKLRGLPAEQQLRAILMAAMNGEGGVSPERLDRLSGYDLEQVTGILNSALASTANYLRHS